jgi:GT2 family glycosyltransferase
MPLSIIIVNYKTPKLVIECLQSLQTEQSFDSYEIIVVDNDSGDDSRELICNSFSNVKWIQMGYNSGFARANNEGIRQSSGDVVLLLNSDTINVESAVEKCYKTFIATDYVACGVQLLNADMSPQISGNYFMKGGLNFLLPLPVTGKFIKFLGSLLKVKKPNVPDSFALVEVDWINGAFLMVKKNAIEKAGLMDEDFFLYAEEAEWCSRLRKLGRLCIFGQYKVVHLQGVTAATAFESTSPGYHNLFDRKGLQYMLSNFVRIRKQYGIGWFLFHLIVFTLTIPLLAVARFFYLITGRKKWKSAVFSFTKNILAIWKFAPRIISNKPSFYKVL